MFERFTERARQVVVLAQEEARALREAVSMGHQHIGTKHVLLGLMHEQEGVAAEVLSGFGLARDQVRSEVVHRLGGPSVGSHPMFVPVPHPRFRRAWPVDALLAGWAMFGVAAGIGLLIGWLIWG